MTQFGTWLKDERERISANHADLQDLVTTPVRLTRYTRTYLAGLKIYLDDALDQVPLMDVGDEQYGRTAWEENRDDFVDRLTDGLICLAHTLVAVGCSDKELARRYEKLLSPITPELAQDVPDEECPDSDEPDTLRTAARGARDVAEK